MNRSSKSKKKQLIENSKKFIEGVIKRKMIISPNSKKTLSRENNSNFQESSTEETGIFTPDIKSRNFYMHKSTEMLQMSHFESLKKKIIEMKRREGNLQSNDFAGKINSNVKSLSSHNILITPFEFTPKKTIEISQDVLLRGGKKKKKMTIKPAKGYKIGYRIKKNNFSERNSFSDRERDRVQTSRTKNNFLDSSPLINKRSPCDNDICQNLTDMLKNIHKNSVEKFNKSKSHTQSKIFRGSKFRLLKGKNDHEEKFDTKNNHLSYSGNLAQSLRIAKQGFYEKQQRSPTSTTNSRVQKKRKKKNGLKYSQNNFSFLDHQSIKIKRKKKPPLQKKSKINSKSLIKHLENKKKLSNGQNMNWVNLRKKKNKDILRVSHAKSLLSQNQNKTKKNNYRELIKMMKRTTKRRNQNKSNSRKRVIRSPLLSPSSKRMVSRTRNLSIKAKEKIKKILKEKKDTKLKKTELLKIIRKYTSSEIFHQNLSKNNSIYERSQGREYRAEIKLEDYDVRSTGESSQIEMKNARKREIFRSMKANNRFDKRIINDFNRTKSPVNFKTVEVLERRYTTVGYGKSSGSCERSEFEIIRDS